MKEIINTCLALLLVIPLTSKAQSVTNNTDSTYTICDTVHFTDNMYFETNLGTQILFTKDAGNLSGTERFTPSFSLICGKWFSPSWGLRLNAQGFSLNGFSTVEGLYIADPVSGSIYGNDDPVRDKVPIRPDGSYRHYLRYLNIHADVQVSLLNLFRDYNDQLRWDVIPSLGFGYMHVMEYKGIPKADIISTNFGVMGKYRLNNNFDINIEFTGSVLPDQFDGRITGNTYEGYGSANIGVTCHFGKKHFKKASSFQTVAPVAPVIKEVIIKDTVYINNAEKGAAEVAITEPVISEAAVPSVKTFNLSIIQFSSESALPASGQELAIRNISGFLEQEPQAKIRLEGYCDDKTGTENYNMELARRRAETIFNILVKEYNINPDRLEIKVIGTSSQPFEKARWNRVVIAVAEDK